MKNMNMLLVVSVLVVVSSQVFASSGSYKPQNIKKVLQYNGFAVIELIAEPDTQGCTRGNGGPQARVGFNSRTDDGRALLANVLTAYASGKRIVVGVSGCIAYSTATIPRVYRVELLNN